MPTSSYWSILQAAQTAIIGLGLADWNSATVPVVLRKLPTAEESLDSVPQIVVCPSMKPETVQPLSGENLVRVGYVLDVVVIAPGQGDLSSTHLDYYASWREALRDLFQQPLLAGVATVFDSDVAPEPLIDRAQVNPNYDYSGLNVTFHNREIRHA